jgi:hypothetical protein
MARFLVTLLASAAFIASAYADSPLTGSWKIHTSAASRESDYACTFTQSENELKGTCNPETGTVQISGKVTGKKVTWVYKSTYDNAPLTVTFDGAVESPGSIKGSVTAEEYGVTGDFSATRSN